MHERSSSTTTSIATTQQTRYPWHMKELARSLRIGTAGLLMGVFSPAITHSISATATSDFPITPSLSVPQSHASTAQTSAQCLSEFDGTIYFFGCNGFF